MQLIMDKKTFVIIFSLMKSVEWKLIAHYRDLMDKYNKVLKSADENYEDASMKCERLRDRRDEIRNQIISVQCEIDNINWRIQS